MESREVLGEPAHVGGEVLPHFAPNCRRGPHQPVAHHQRYGQVVRKLCDCPCHLGCDGNPWWTDVKATAAPAPRATEEGA